MKRKIFTLLLSSMLVVSAFAQKPTAVFKKASVDPVIDGVVDDVWAEANAAESINLPMGTDVPTLGADGETYWQGLWTDNGLYVLIVVNDDNFYPSYIAGGESYNSDKAEIYIDVNYELVDGAGPSTGGSGHYQIAPAFTAENINGTPETESNGAVHAFMVNDPDYIAEYFIPFSMLLDKAGGAVDKSGNIGFDVTIIDNDLDGAKNRAVWANTGTTGESWSNMDDCGIITLDGAEASILIGFGGITLSGETTITEDNGTVQIIADISPENATNKNLAWSVENAPGQTGRAKVSSTGLVTGLADGEVTVWGRATDASYEEASIVITISGQNTTIWDLNIIKNGTFSELNADGKALYWGGDHTINADGVSVHPGSTGPDPWSYQSGQGGLEPLLDVAYTFSFKAWADAERTFTVDFEDPNNGYNRVGASSDPRVVPTDPGRSEWLFDVTTDPTWYTFDVIFDEVVENSNVNVIFQLGKSDVVTYIDSVVLVTAVEYDPTTSVPSRSFESSVRLYPNPIDGSNMLTVDRLPANAKITIFDSVGRMVKEVVATQDRADFNVSSYARGVYFVRVNNEPVMKFIK